ncbi:MAG: putative addiction module antidote protein [Shinella sp.]|jgi:probable addiction module antidote protein|nr:putative addiction module antidote protein [Shinella sp.]
MARASRPFDFDKYDDLLRDPENAAVYLAEFLESGDMELFQEGLRHVAKAQAGGLAKVAEQAQLNRGSLYKSLSKTGKPQFETLAKMLEAMGLQFTITPIHQ